MARPANAAVREIRRRSTALDLERINVLKALTAAEHSRRQFILNFAASRDTQLLIPGKKSDAVKAAEEWVAIWLSQNGYLAVKNDFFKYTVDARLWSAHVGDDVDFPFAFMRGKEPSLSDISEGEYKRPMSTASLVAHEIDVRDGEVLPVTAPAESTGSPEAHSPRKQQRPAPSTPQSRRQRATTYQGPAQVPDRKRSMSLTSIDDMKTPKVSPDKLPFLVRLGRSWSRRLSSVS
ncbi:hypothetical protein C8A01DRAFT_35012 [Parachaetomium inaequale]|uniref:Uncharacterized protein n=1 Tax=Parachaetomium inaequale TaxID=2588326 RepID=A0AAN6SSY4_9PEZI|nr:hypothetical protein C8A01DRAFT_35012 [Parachaetomium inaequale]